MPKTDVENALARRQRLKVAVAPSHADRGVLGRDGRCNCLKSDGEGRCSRRAGWGTDHHGYGACKDHGGTSPSLVRHAAKQHVRRIAAEMEMAPSDAMALRIRLAAGAVAYYRHELDLLQGEGVDPTWIGAVDRLPVSATEDDTAVAHTAQSQGVLFVHYEKLYARERTELGEAARLAIAAGLEEQRVALEQERVQILVVTLRNVLLDLNLSPEQRALSNDVVRRHLRAIDTQAVVA